MSGKMIQRKKPPLGYSLRLPSGAARWPVAAFLRSRSVSLLAAAVAMAFPIAAARAGGPIQVANVAAGTAAFAQAGSVTTITAANNTIINYQKFGIPQGNTVNFIQPSASARVLNRIIGPTPTQIDGTLNANGVVYFVNPAGVMFGAGAVINVGQLYAAAGHMSDADFLSGVNSFTDNSGSITNAGVIKAGDVTFAAGNISNNGTILTPEGMVVMAAGKDVYVSKLGSPFLVQVAGAGNTNAKGATPGVSNSGTIDAAGGDVAIRAGDMYSLAINTSGTIKAANVSIQAAGADSTVLVSGKIDAANQGAGSTGGTIAVNGGNIGIGVTADAAGNYNNASAALSAQGAHGGGKILIGVKPDAASVTGYSDASGYDFIGSDAILNASSTGTGNGGLVDTSGQVLDVSPGAAITAAGAGGGSAGEWLLDPLDVTISTAADSNTSSTGSNPEKFKPTATGANVNTSTLDTALASNTGVLVDATGSSGAALGNITVSSAINPTLTASTTLTLEAANGIDIEAGIAPASGSAASADLAVTLQAGGNLTSGTGAGSAIYVNAPINTNGGNFTATVSSGNTLNFTLNNVLAGTNSSSNNGGIIDINSSGTAVVSSSGSINVSGNNSSTTGGGNAGAITIFGSTGVTIDGNLSAAGGNSSASGSTGGPGGGILISSASGTVNLSGVTINTTGGSDGAASDGGGGGVGIDATGVGAISLTGVTINTSSQGVGGAGAIALYSGTGAIAITGSTFNSSGAGGGAAGIQTADDVTLSGTNIITTSGSTGATLGGGGGISGTAASLVVGGGSGNGGAGNGGGISGSAASAGSATPNSSAGGSTSGGSSGGGAPGAAGALSVIGSGTGNSITVNGPITGSTGAATFSSPTIDLNASISAPVSVAGTGVNLVAVGSSGSYKGDIQQGVSLLASGGTLDLTALAGTISSDNVIFGLPIKILGSTTGSVTAASWTTSGITAAVTIQGDFSASATSGNGFDFQGNTTISGTTILESTNSAQVFGGTVTLGSETLTLNGTTLTAGGSPAFSGSSGTLNLGFSASGVSVSSFSGVGTLNFTTPFTFASGETLAGASGTTTFQAAVTLDGADAMDTGASSGNVVFASALNASTAADSLTIGTTTVPESATFDQSVGATLAPVSLTVNGATTLNGNVTTTGAQNYTGAVALARTPIKLSGATLNASSLSGASFTGVGETLNLHFNFRANLGAISALGILEDTGTGTTTLNGNISTTGAQNYTGAVALNSSTITLTANSSGTVQTIIFGSTVDGADTLNIGGGGLTSNAVFQGKVGGTTNLAALNVSGATSLGGNVTTTGAQNFLGAVTLNASPITLTANNSGTAEAITFGNTVNGADTLSIGGGGLISNAVFDSDVGRTTNLAALNVSGTTLLSGNITTTSGQTYDGTLSLNAANITLTDSGVTGIALNSVVATSSDNLAISQTGTGTVSLDGSIATLNNFSVATAGTIILGGSITANDLSISTSSTGGGNPLSVPVAVTINADTQSYAATGTGDTLGSLANLLLADTVGTAAPRSISLTQDATIQDTGLPALTQFTTGVLTGSSYFITSLSGNITLVGGSSTPVSDANLILSAPHGNISLGASGAFTISSLTATSATTGAITLEGNVTTTNGQTYNSAVTLGAGATLTTTNSAVTFASTVDSASGIAEALTVNAGTGTVIFGGAVGAVNPLASLTVDSPTIINGGAMTSTNGQSYHGSVTLGANTTLTDPLFVDFAGTVTGPEWSLTLADTGGASTLGSVVTTKSLTITAGTIALNGGTVTTSNGQNYIGAVTLGADTTLTDSTSIDFANAVSGAGSSLTLADSGGTSTFSGTITTSALHVTAGTIALNGGAVATTNGENYNGAVTLGANTTLTDPLSIAFLNTVSGPGFFLTLADSGGTSTLAGALNTNSLNITAAAIDLNGATVTTANNQSYNGIVTLGSDTALTTTNNGAVNFSSTVNAATAGAQSLAVDTGMGTVTFGGAVGGTNSLASLTVSGPSIITGGAVTTSGGQSYIGSVTLGANTVMATTNNGGIRFSSSIDGVTAGAEGLTLNAGAGTVTFGGAVGGLNSLAALTVSGPTVINGGAVTTTGAQIYDNAVALGADSILATTNSAVNFASTVDSASPTAETLTINAGTGTVTFGGAVGQSHALANLTVIGLTQINGGTVITNGGQSYNSIVALGANAVLTGTTLNSSTTPAIFSGSGDTLTLNFTGDANLGTIATLGSLVSSGLGATTLYGDITTSSAQSYNGTIALAATPITLTGTTLNGSSTPAVFSGSGGSLTLAFSGTADLGTITTLGSLADTGSGTITLYGNIATSGAQSYNGTVALAATPITLTGTMLNNSTTPAIFSGSGDTLTLDFSGNANLGTIATLGSLVSTGLGAITLYGDITTSGAQSYNGTVSLASAAITLTGTKLNSSSTPAVFSGSGGALTLAFSGTADLGAISALGSLADTGLGTTTLYGNITTSGAQSYNGTVSLGSAAITLTGTTLNSSTTPAVFSGSGDALTLNFSGNTNIGTISTLGSLANTGPGATTLYGNITTSGFQSYNGTVSLSAGAITLTGTTLNSSSTPAVFSGSGGALTLAFSGNANLGTITALNSLADTGSGTTTLYGNITTSGNQTYSSPTGIASALTLTGTNLNPSPNAAAIFSGAGAPALTLDFSRSYNVNLGASSGLASLDLGVPSTVPFNILTSTTLSYPLTVAGTVTVGQSGDPAGSVITLTGSAFTFKSSFDAASPNDGVVFAALSGTPSNVEFDGVVGGSSANPDLASLTVQGTTTVNGGAVNTVNSQIYDGGVTINGGGTTTFTSTQGGIAENGGISDTTGGITLSPDSALMVPNPDPILGAGATTGDFRPQNYLTLNGNITASGTVTLAPNAPSFNNVNNPVPDAATIITTIQSGTVTVTGTNIYMGMSQKWTSLTSLTLNANVAGGANVAALGDLNVAGTLTVRANTIDMLLRPAGSQLVPGSSSGVLGLHVNTPGSEGVDIVANSLNLTGSVVPVGAVTDYAPQFAYGPGGTVTGSITPNSPGVHYYGVNVVPSTLMASGIADGRLTTYYLDLKASGPSTSNVTVAVAPILPPPPPQFNSVVVLSSEQRQILREAGINARNTSIDNILNLFGGKAVFNDIPTSDGMIIVHPTLLDYYVTTSRLPYQQTKDFIAMYRDLFLAPVIDPKTHQPELDQRGNPIYRSRRMELHVLFRDSYNDYAKAVGAAHATPLGFRTWLEKTPGQTKVLSTLNQLRTLLRQVRQLGLTSVELRLSHSTILAELNPGALSERQFEETVMGHRLSKL